MSRLVGYGTGEVVDRLTILELKILHGRAAGKDVLHFEEEWSAVVRLLTDPHLYFNKAVRLAVVNAALWTAEDALREYQGVEETVLLASAGARGLRIQQLNDLRAQIIAQINRLTGDPLAGEEKI